MHNTLNLYTGDDKDYTLRFMDAAGTAIDITGWTVMLTVKENETDSDDDALIQVTQTSHTNPTGGITSLSIPRSTTESLTPGARYYDVQVLTDDNKVRTITKGTMNILQDISNAIS